MIYKYKYDVSDLMKVTFNIAEFVKNIKLSKIKQFYKSGKNEQYKGKLEQIELNDFPELIKTFEKKNLIIKIKV